MFFPMAITNKKAGDTIPFKAPDGSEMQVEIIEITPLPEDAPTRTKVSLRLPIDIELPEQGTNVSVGFGGPRHGKTHRMFAGEEE